MSPQVMNLDHGARLLFIGLITQADDQGRGVADPRKLKASIFGGDDVTSADVRRWLDDCSRQGLAVLYHDEIHGDLYQLPSWKRHQSIDRAKQSTYPSAEDSSSARRQIDVQRTIDREGSEGKGREGKGSEGSVVVDDSPTPRAVDNSGDKRPNCPQPDPHELLTQIRTVYPEGTYGGQNWILAERELIRLLDGGESPDALSNAAKAYGLQQASMGKVGTQYIRSPEKFYAAGWWRGPFPVSSEGARPGRRKSFEEIHAGLSTSDDETGPRA